MPPAQYEPVPVTLNTVGKALMVKVPALVAVPPPVVTLMVPVAPAAGVAVICVAEFTVKDNALVKPKLTTEAPVKLVPVITTGVVLAQPKAGVKLVMTGGGIAFKAINIAPFLSAVDNVAAPAPITPAVVFTKEAAPTDVLIPFIF